MTTYLSKLEDLKHAIRDQEMVQTQFHGKDQIKLISAVYSLAKMGTSKMYDGELYAKARR